MADAAYLVDVGQAIVTAAVAALGATAPKFIQWGTGATGAATTDSAVETPAAEARTTGTITSEQTTTAGDTVRVVGTIVCAGAGKAITEVGLYTNATTGTLFVHGTFSAINVSVGDSIAFTINSVFNQA